MRVLVTGANGFVGRELCAELLSRGFEVTRALRSGISMDRGVVRDVVVGEIDGDTRWDEALSDVGAVVHLAARVHVMRDAEGLDAYRAVNTFGTSRLGRAAYSAGVHRLVFLSSIKVNGEGSSAVSYRSTDIPRPSDAYAVSKLEAEQELLGNATARHREAVIIRPPLVYGPHVRGNFRRLMRLAASGWPLPLGSISNRRSLISIWNLVDFIVLALTDPRAAGHVWVVSDGQDLSTCELLRILASGAGRQTRLFPVPGWLLRTAATCAGRGAEFLRLTESLRVDITETREALDWHPPISVEDGLRRTAKWFCAEDHS